MAPRNEPMRIDMRIDGATETLKAFKDLPKEANERLRQASLRLSELLASRVQAAGQAEGRQAALLAATVKPKRDRIPSITVGGTARIGHAWPKRGKAKAFELLFGSEFGASSGHGFKPHRGQQGYWIWPTVIASQEEIGKEWLKAADDIIAEFTDGPGGS